MSQLSFCHGRSVMNYKRLTLRVGGVHVTCITVFNVICDFLIHRRPVNDLTCSSQASLYSDVSTVDLLFNFLSQGLRDNTSLAFKDDSILYGKFFSDTEVLGDFLWY